MAINKQLMAVAGVVISKERTAIIGELRASGSEMALALRDY